MLPFAASAADETPLTKRADQAISSDCRNHRERALTKGVTHPWRLTLSNGTIAHDAAFQPVGEHRRR